MECLYVCEGYYSVIYTLSITKAVTIKVMVWLKAMVLLCSQRS